VSTTPTSSSATRSVPVIDISGWASGDPAARAAIVDAVRDAATTYGFMQITGHGIPDDLIADMLAVNDEFFALPTDVKEALVSPPEVNRGYSGIGAESLAYSLGVEAPPDIFESFNIARDAVDETDPAVVAERHRFLAPNVWPDEAMPSMRPRLNAYYDAVAELARTVTRIFAVALDMPEDFFVQRCRHPIEVMRMIRYERQPGSPDPVEGQQRMGAHTDYGIVTVLHADKVAGLEIVGPDGEWWPVLPADGAYIINLGDLLAEWTNDHWRSTIHRVSPPPAQVEGPALRRSTAFFLDGDYDMVVECLPSCCSQDDPPKYAPITGGDHLLEKLGGSRGLVAATDSTDTVKERMATVTDG
jgi:isopenicillin N synthase-like dioxygenase